MEVMGCVPTGGADIVHAAVAPLSGTASQPASVTLPSLKATTPPGDAPLTVAVNVTLCPRTEGFAEEVTSVVVCACAFVRMNAVDAVARGGSTDPTTPIIKGPTMPLAVGGLTVATPFVSVVAVTLVLPFQAALARS